MSAALQIPRALQGALIRRFCDCDPGPHGWGSTRRGRCACGLPRRATGWTVERLGALRDQMRAHASLAVVAELLDETQHDCNVALNALLGRTPAHALAALEARVLRT